MVGKKQKEELKRNALSPSINSTLTFYIIELLHFFARFIVFRGSALFKFIFTAY